MNDESESVTKHYVCDCGYEFYAVPNNMDLSGLVVEERIACGVCAEQSPPLCAECGKYPSDWPSKICVGCAAYKEHAAM